MEGVVSKSAMVTLRDGIDSDRSFIFASWLKGLRHGNDYFGLIQSDAYFKHYHRVIETILDDFEVTVRVACLKEDPDVILGYAVYKNDTLHWTHVKKAWRKIGLARDLVPPNITTVSNVTKVGISLLRKHPNVSFNPYPES